MYRKACLVLILLAVALPALAGVPIFNDGYENGRSNVLRPFVLAGSLPILIPSPWVDLARRLEIAVSAFLAGSADSDPTGFGAFDEPTLTTMVAPVAIEGG